MPSVCSSLAGVKCGPIASDEPCVRALPSPSRQMAARRSSMLGLIKVWSDGTIEFKTQILNLGEETFIAGHIHLAPVHVAGAVVVPLFLGPATSASHIKQSGIATPNAGTTGTALCQNPSAYYVNYHTTAFTGGAIR